jgi:hypothetical protein
MKNRLTIKSSLILAFFAFLALVSCNNDDENSPGTSPKVTKGIYVLNEGLFNLNNASLTYYDVVTSQPTTDFFKNNNGRGLGDTGNDLKNYGSKLYAVINGSSQLEVIDVRTGMSIKQIPMLSDKGVPRQPRNITFHKGFAYVCSFDGTVGRLDTATLVFDKFITVGRSPEDICVANDKLYVTNSGGLDYPDFDKTVSVINTSTFTEIKKITVEINPGPIMADQYGDVYLVSRGNYDDIGYSFQSINSTTDELKKTFTGLQALNFAIKGDSAFLYDYNYTTMESSIKVLNVKDEVVVSDKFITDNTKITTPYSIEVDPSSGDVYIADAYDYSVTGDVFCFSKDGKLKFKFQTGINPNNIVFFQQ